MKQLVRVMVMDVDLCTMSIIGTDSAQAARHLEAGSVVAIPTETVYGLAANAFNEASVLRIFSVKERPSFDPLIVHIGRPEDIHRVARALPPRAQALMDAFWPGPLTLLLPKHPDVPDIVTSGLDTVGVRMPAHPMTLALLRALPFPLAAPSANPFGYVSPTTAQHVLQQLGDAVAYVLDGGPCSVGLESTIIDLSGGEPKVLRLGGLSLEALEAAVGQALPVQTSSSNPRAPGMLVKHYAPRTPLLWQHEVTELPAGRIGYLRFSSPLPQVDPQHQWLLSPANSLPEAASKLFATLRLLDDMRYDWVLVEKFPETGLGLAINDRLTRAVQSRLP